MAVLGCVSSLVHGSAADKVGIRKVLGATAGNIIICFSKRDLSYSLQLPSMIATPT